MTSLPYREQQLIRQTDRVLQVSAIALGLAVIVGMTDNRFTTASRTVSVSIDVNDLDPSRGFGVAVNDSAQSSIRLIEKVDVKVLEEEMLASFRRLPRLVKMRDAASSGCLSPLCERKPSTTPELPGA